MCVYVCVCMCVFHYFVGASATLRVEMCVDIEARSNRHFSGCRVVTYACLPVVIFMIYICVCGCVCMCGCVCVCVCVCVFRTPFL